MSFVSPTRALIKREVRGMLLSKRPFYICAVWVLCGFLVVNAFWPEGSAFRYAYAESARLVVVALGAMALACVALTVPALATLSIARERDDELLDQLRLTLITNGGLVRAKATASLTLSLLLLVALLPLFSVVQFIVGLDNVQLAQLIAYLFLISLLCAMCGIASAAFFKRTLIAVVAVYCVMLPLFFYSYMLLDEYNNLSRAFAAGGRWFRLSDIGLLTPVGVLIEIVARGASPIRFTVACLIPIVVTTILYRLAVRRIGRHSEPPRVIDEKPVDDQEVLHARRVQFPFYLIDPLRRKPTIGDGQNAMVVREIRWGLFSRGTWMIRTFYVTFIVFIFPMLGACMEREVEARMTIICMQMLMLVFAAPVLVGNAWTKERELGNIDMIRMTLLRARDLYLGKAAGGIVAVAPVIGALMLTSLPAYVWHYNESMVFLCGAVTLVNCALIATVLSLFSSVASKRSTTAIAAGALFCMIVFIGAYLATALFSGADFTFFRFGLDNPLPLLSPIVAYSASFGEWDRYNAHAYPAAWAVAQIFFVGIAVVFAALSLHRLSRREMRDA